MTQILFKEYFAKISYVVDKLVSEKVNFSSSNSCLIQHVAKNIMGVKQKWIEIGRLGGTYKGSWDFALLLAFLITKNLEEKDGQTRVRRSVSA